MQIDNCGIRGSLEIERRVLEVSDSQALREIIASVCDRCGFDMIQARCGDEALRHYRKCGPFALVLSDLYWYDEGGAIEPPLSNTETIRHGIQLALAIRKLAPKQKIVIHTADGDVQKQIPTELADIRILRKPVDIEQLQSLL
jgi:CheY-like chemotaxis protein